MNVYFDKTNQRTFGTWPLRGKELTSALEIAIDIGYRSVDTAQMYGNEADIGASLTDLGLSRDELCITTKVHPDNFDDADFMPSVEKSLEKLRLDCVDVLLLHWPPIGEDIAPPLRLLEKAYEKGFARNIGVSNYTTRMMHDAKKIIDSLHQGKFSPPRLDSNTELFGYLQRMAEIKDLGDGVVFTQAHYLAAARLTLEQLNIEQNLSLGEIRDLINTNRRIAQALVETMDKEGLTQRVGDERRITEAGKLFLKNG